MSRRVPLACSNLSCRLTSQSVCGVGGALRLLEQIGPPLFYHFSGCVGEEAFPDYSTDDTDTVSSEKKPFCTFSDYSTDDTDIATYTMDHRPTFRREPSGEVTLKPSAEALALAKAFRAKPAPFRAWAADRVTAKAKSCVVAGGGDPGNTQLVLSETEVQFGQYRSQTFKWLLTHDVGYAAMILAAHQKEREGGDTSLSPTMANKDALSRYAHMFPDVVRAIRERRIRDGSSTPGQEDRHLVGFGVHQSVSFQDLYNATDREKKSYVQWVRRAKVRPGTKMEVLQNYIRFRDQKRRGEMAQPSTSSSTSMSLPVVAPSVSGVPTHRSSSHELTDTEILSVASDLDIQASLGQ